MNSMQTVTERISGSSLNSIEKGQLLIQTASNSNLVDIINALPIPMDGDLLRAMITQGKSNCLRLLYIIS